MPYIRGVQLHQVQHLNPSNKSQAIGLLDPKNHSEFVSVQDYSTVLYYAQAETLPCKTEPPREWKQPKTSLHAKNE